VYGAERRGAAVASYAWIDQGPIRERGVITRPDLIVVADETLLADPGSGVLVGAEAAASIFINTDRGDTLTLPETLRSRMIFADLTSRTLAALGRAAALSASLGAAAVRLLGAIPLEALLEALRDELTAIGVAPAELAKNEQLARDVFAALEPLTASKSGQSLTLAMNTPTGHAAAIPASSSPVTSNPVTPSPATSSPASSSSASSSPALTSLTLPGQASAAETLANNAMARVGYEGVMRGTPSILASGNSAARHTGAWRVQRPVIDPALCSRCGLCFVQCPDGVVSLDAEGYPVIDYDHCKGCLICQRVCPVNAIHEERETRAW
jgi:pyruvate ferredoxin oxidoreductase gamma subunit